MKNTSTLKRIIITGASSGIGYQLAKAFASRGVPVGLAARHTEPLLELKRQYPDNVEYISLDITKPSAAEKLNELIDKCGGMDIFLHCAGILDGESTLDPEAEARVVRTNAEGFARMVSAAYLYFRQRRKRGQIAAITSVAGIKGIGAMAAYSASKAFDQEYLVALRQLSNTQNAGIYITDIRPGWIRTPLVDETKTYPMEMDLQYAVPQIIEAIVRRRRVAYIDWRWGLLCSLWRLLPDTVWTHVKITPWRDKKEDKTQNAAEK